MRAVYLLCIVGVAACKPDDAANCRDCSVVLITVDTLRRDHVTSRTMPRTTDFFQSGTVFERATSPSPCTLPAIQQILTGTIDAADERPRLAETLASRGYRTAAFVSQHFFRDRRGPRHKFARGFQIFDVQGYDELDAHGMTRRRAQEVSERALAWLATLNDHDRFHLWLHFFDPHDPYAPPSRTPPENGVHPGDRRARQCAGPLRRGGCERRGRAGGRSLFSAEETRQLVDLYNAEISYVDKHVGRVLESLRKRHRRTVFLFTSDHGERLGEDGRWDHCQSLHAREIDVPLLVRVRDGPLKRNMRREATNVTTLDIVPTVHGLLGVDPTESDGLDLRTLPARRCVVTVWRDERLAIKGDWKLFVTDKIVQLAHAVRDPSERQDFSAEEPGVRAAMLGAIRGMPARYGAAQDESQAIVERLRAVGYIQ